QLAHFLRRNYRIEPDDRIGIQLDRSADLLVAILGALKSGAAYVPIDINYPPDRQHYIQADSACKAVIDRQFLHRFDAHAEQLSTQNPEIINDPADLAYVIYTSGTTGKPKGVQVAHRNVLSIHADWKRAYRLDTFQVNLLQLASVSFDVFVGDICRTLLSGGTMIMPSDAHKLNPEALYTLLEQHRISIFEGTPGLLLPLFDYIDRNQKDYSFLKLIIFGSDSINNTVFHSIKYKYERDGIRVVNSYGVTEATIDSTYFDGDCPALQGPAPIGKPFSNTRIYLLNPARQLVPIGVFGQVYIGGAGVSRGYHQQPELTAARFVAIPQSKTVVYDTGDLARWLPDGNLEFLGRADHQVKLRGYRIEPGEIENTIRAFDPAVEQVLVCLKVVGGEDNLVGYFVATQPLDKAELKRFLAEHLPEYMVPGFLVQLERFPLTPNGKLDRAQLPDITETDTIRQQYVAPQNETEAVLVDIWKEILGFEQIGTADNFFELGGHSLKITKLKNLIARRLQVDPAFNALFIHSTVREQARLVEQSTRQQFQSISPAPEQADYPLSAAQQRIWVLSQFEGANAAYNMPGTFLVDGDLQIDLLRQALDRLIERHESLRTRFVQGPSGELRQHIVTPGENGFELSYTPETWLYAPDEQVHTAVRELVTRPFALDGECLIRVALYRLGERRHLMVVILHHIISDGWSIDLMTNELFALYKACLNGEESPLPELRLQYRDYAVWEQNQEEDGLQAARDYWLQRFAGTIPVLELPYCAPRPRQKSYAGAVYRHTFDAAHSSAFKAFCQARQSTLFMGLVALVKVLLHRYTQQTDLIIGTPVAGRAHEDLRDQVGVFINTLALRTDLDPTDSFEQLLQKIQQSTLEAYQHQQYPFDRLVEELALPRNLGRNPLFDVLVTLQNTDEAKVREHTIEGLTLKPYHQTGQWTSRFDLDLVFEETAEGIELALVYDNVLFDGAFVERFCAQLWRLMEGSLSSPEAPVYSLEVLTPAELQDVLLPPVTDAFTLEDERTLLDHVRMQALRRPEAPAIADRKQQLSYGEVDQWTDQIAAYLASTLDHSEKAIGVVLERSAETLLILLGILKAGRAYIPLDPTFPLERLAYIAEHSGIQTLIQGADYHLSGHGGLRSLSAEAVLAGGGIAPAPSKIPGATATDTAYIIYTSGSTGNPKGVEIGHRSLLNFLLSMQREPGLTTEDTLYAVTTYSFDISILEFFGPLLAGGCVYIADNRTLADPEQIIEELKQLRPTVMQATPSFYQLLFHAGWTGDPALRVLCGGDLLSEALAARLLESCKELWNMYGPTETTIWSSLKRINRPEEAAVIGKPIAHTSMYVLGAHKELLPTGAIGALYIGGAGLAKGYYQNAALTAVRFLDSPFGDGRMYETGDLVRRQANGEFVFLGRNDNQVKIRGYRIELGEIESKLNLLPGIQQAVAVAKRAADGEAQLVAYYKSEAELEIAALRRQLAQGVPDYMIPAHFIAVSDFPLTPNKKIDRKVLTNRADINLRMVQVEYRPPETETEQRLAALWAQALNKARVGLDDDFFDLGGNSLSATRLVSIIRVSFDCSLSIDKVFEYPTIALQADLIDNLQLISRQVVSIDEETEFENFTL
ncbi:MAG: amino acid adenylation domain-containing protein, partial [Phaeodactylibacter sp.]|nr:amino acid adenylation domain-containing protein [Phaeodactylibacter sp.]